MKGNVSKIILELKPPMLTTISGRDELTKKLGEVIKKQSRKERKVFVIFEE